ncbi:MAG: hypothetical protein IPP27_04805 [Bacteroidetes bacterium]|nr:hypothetical protein [Bacteroidota bacterium]MBP6426064.1 hypothetical protein [Bacteroidia bacterium]MBK8363945.1 hypothetical protein [Bacteroidota bacterium]MBK9415085.1 hypothetical protein [Bacteroidota bacterium]MBL0031517.1 hypothetical protein [Bacteroidota bacterium]
MKKLADKDLKDVLDEKNKLIINQTRRINFLEEKILEIRQKYFKLKYDEEKMDIHINRIS